MKFISEKFKYKLQKNIKNNILIKSKFLPESVFTENYLSFKILDFDYIFSKDFFDKIIFFIKQVNEQSLTFFVLDPHPRKYFFKHFKKFSSAEFNLEDNAMTYQDFLNEDPGDSPADALIHNSNQVLLFSETESWAIYCDREYEICIASFLDYSQSYKFAEVFKDDVLSNEELVAVICRLGLGKKDIESFIHQINVNYGK